MKETVTAGFKLLSGKPLLDESLSIPQFIQILNNSRLEWIFHRNQDAKRLDFFLLTSEIPWAFWSCVSNPPLLSYCDTYAWGGMRRRRSKMDVLLTLVFPINSLWINQACLFFSMLQDGRQSRRTAKILSFVLFSVV